jgi:hypothetical protein
MSQTAPSLSRSSAQEVSLEVYKNIFDTWRYEVDSYWQRNSYFAAFETALVGGCWYVAEHKHLISALAFAALGFLSALIWFLTSIAVHRYVDYWWESIKRIEDKLSLKSESLDFASQHRGSRIRPRPSHLVLAIPILFMIAWIVVFLFAVHGLGAYTIEPRLGYDLAEWMLVIVGGVTAVVIGWQSYETRSAAQASRVSAEAAKANIELQEAQFKQWIVLQGWRASLASMPNGRPNELQLSVDAVNPTNFPLTFQGMMLRVGSTEQNKFDSHILPPGVPYAVQFSVPLTSADEQEYRQSRFIFQIRGMIRFHDVRNHFQEQPFGGLVSCNASNPVEYTPHGVYEEHAIGDAKRTTERQRG